MENLALVEKHSGSKRTGQMINKSSFNLMRGTKKNPALMERGKRGNKRERSERKGEEGGEKRSLKNRWKEHLKISLNLDDRFSQIQSALVTSGTGARGKSSRPAGCQLDQQNTVVELGRSR